MNLLTVDEDKCIVCMACVDVCPSCIIEMGDTVPHIDSESERDCIRCGHCVAVCPAEALDHRYALLSSQVPINRDLDLQADRAIQFLRSRRSIRCYRETPVPREKLSKLLDIARFAPTSGNVQGISYLVISNREKLRQISEVIVEWMEGEVIIGSPFAKSYKNYIKNYHNGTDTVLRGAPHLILALSTRAYSSAARENSRFTLEYVELLAPILGIGTCWAGLVQYCVLSKYQPLIDVFDLPEGYVIVGAIMAGFSEYDYHRLVERNPLSVTWQ